RSSPLALNCGYGCTSVETERNLFFECAHVVPLWSDIETDWRHFFGDITWELVYLPCEPKWTAEAARRASVLNTLWSITRSIWIHVIWTARNKHVFEDKPPLDANRAIYQVYSCFSAHFRSLLRFSDPADLTKLLRCLRHFPVTSRLKHFASSNPRLFAIRQKALCIDRNGTLRALPLLPSQDQVLPPPPVP
ncbi:hypothetical protein F441_03651, partial [Phytophthora nicotianae CJ01A1]